METARAVAVDETSPVEACERGQGMVEYAVILMLVALLLILSVQVIGHQASNMFSNVSSGLNGH